MSITEYYARRAAEYEEIYDRPERQDDLRDLRAFLQETLAGTHVYEVACGTGYWTSVAATTAASVFATDINETVLAIARRKSFPPGTVTFVRADAWQPPPVHRRCDAGLGMFWWSHLPKARLGEFLRSFHTRLTPGARVVFADNVYVAGSSTPISRTDESGNTYQLRRLKDGSTHEVLKNFPTETELRDAVRDAGDRITVRFLTYYWLLSYRIR